jgi:hypothetical protein
MRKRSRLEGVSDKAFCSLFSQSKSLTDFAFLLGICNPSGGMYLSLKKRIAKLNLDVKSQWSPWRVNVTPFNRLEDREYFAPNTKHGGAEMRKRICDEKLIPYRCAFCGNEGKWNGMTLHLEIDHVNGDHYDNRLENLRFLCPNCHSLTSTFGGRNKNRYDDSPLIKKEKQRTYLPIKTQATCQICGKELTRWSRSGLCLSCANLKKRKVKRPTKFELVRLLQFHSFEFLAKQYGVSSRAIRKWCIDFGVPSNLKQLRNFIF